MKISELILSSAGKSTSEESINDELLELASSYRVLDITLREGAASAKLQKANTRNQKVEILFSPLSDSSWNELFNLFSKKSIHFANLLSQKYSDKFISIMHDEIEKISSEKDFLKYFINGKQKDRLCDASLALLRKVITKIEESPWFLLLIFGRGREESILEIHERRRNIIKQIVNSEKKEKEDNSKSELELLKAESVQDFWNHGKDLMNISYQIKADELPAATLKRLDAMPLLGIEEHVESKVEAAYEKIARLAQSYGLSF